MQTVTLDCWPTDRSLTLLEDDEGTVTTQIGCDLSREDATDTWRIEEAWWVNKTLWHDGCGWGDEIEPNPLANQTRQVRLWLKKPHIASMLADDLQAAATERWERDMEG